jgi:peptidoglycan-N-acetylglucosamine deacetylase
LIKKSLIFLLIIFCVTLPCFASGIWGGNKHRNVIALTFDDGPKPEYVQPILEQLDKYGAKATFFVVGEEAEKNPDIIMRMADAGHEIANHTYSHKPAKTMTVNAYLYDVKKCNNVIYDITGVIPKYFRPPGGGLNPGISAGLKRIDLTPIFWSMNIGDYTDVTPGYEVPEDVQLMAKELAQKVLDKAKPGTIILLHSSSEQTVRALPMILKGLKDKGYGLVTVDDLIKEKI